MLKPKLEIRATAGMSFSAECRWHFWLGWASLTVGAWATTYSLYVCCRHLAPVFYFPHLFLALLAPFLALAWADLRVVALYYQTYSGLSRRNLAQVILDPTLLERVRAELRLNPLLCWARPPHSRGIREQLMSAALWWPALTLPQGSGWFARYGEWLVDVLLGYLALALGTGWGILGLWGPYSLTSEIMPVVYGLVGVGLLVIGYSSIRLAGRRQAVVDYFTTWLVTRTASAEDSRGARPASLSDITQPSPLD